jgi:predicted double-glycine peptidase
MARAARVVSLLGALLLTPLVTGAALPGPGAAGQPFRHWLALRDQGVIRQHADYSCGLAALATVLRYDYGQQVSERSLLRLLLERAHDWQLSPGWRRHGVSFATLAALARAHGFEAAGFEVDAALLAHLSVPAIAYLEHHQRPHFTVVRGISTEGVVHLADPSWGNRHLPMRRFLTLWQTDGDPHGRGRLLLLRPTDEHAAMPDRRHYRPVTLRPLQSPVIVGACPRAVVGAC